MLRLLLICLGGALGTGARYLLSGWALSALGPVFPYGTLMINAIGSLLISFIMHISLNTSLISPTLRLVLTTGVMGGFTTYSTFNYETLRYWQEGAWLWGLLYILSTVVLCLVMGTLGLFAARWLVAH